MQWLCMEGKFFRNFFITLNFVVCMYVSIVNGSVIKWLRSGSKGSELDSSMRFLVVKKIAIIIDNFIDSFEGVLQGVSLSLITID